MLGGQVVAPHDLVGDHDGQHDRPLHDQDDLAGHPEVVQRQRGLVEERPEQRTERDPDRVVAAEQRDGDAGEPVARRRGQRVREVAAEQLGQPDEPGHRPGQEQRNDHHAVGVDAAGRRRGRRLPGRGELEAEPRPVEQEPVPDAHEGGHEHHPEQHAGVAEREARELTAGGDRRGGYVVALQHPELLVADEVGDQARRDEVQHDRRDDLADPAVGLEQRRDPGPGRPDEHRDEDDHGRVQHGRQHDRPADDRGDTRGQPELALDPDVEQLHLEADRHGEAGEVVDGAAVDSVDRRGPLAELRDHDAQRGERRAAGQEQRDGAQQGGEDDGERGRQQDRPGPTHGCVPARSRRPGRVRARHRRPELLGRDRRRVGVGDEPPGEHDLDRVREPDQLVEVGADEEDGEAAAPGVAQLVPDAGLRADVDAAGGVRGDEQQRLAGQLAADDELLLVAARQRRRRDVDARRADVEVRDDALGVAARRGAVEQVQAHPAGKAAARDGRPALVAEHPVDPQRLRGQQAVPGAVLGDVADPGLAAVQRAGVAEVASREQHPPARRPTHPHDRLDELGLPVALDPGDAEHLARPHDEVDPGEQRPTPVLAGELQALDAQHLAVGHRRVPGPRVGQLAADHHLGELAVADRGRVRGPDGATAPDHRDPVGDRPHLVELVRDEQERVALGAHLPQGREQLVDLLRNEDGRRLVEDHGAGAAVEDLEDLHPLPVGDAEALDEDLRRRGEPDDGGELDDPLPSPRPDPVQRLGAEQHVLGDGEVVGEHEVLVHHADPGPDRVGGRAEPDGPAVDADRSLVRLLHAVEDLHQRRLAGAVLPAQGVHLAPADREVDPVVRDDPGVPLRDPGQLDRVGPRAALGHASRLTTPTVWSGRRSPR